MKLGLRELVILSVMLALLGGSYFFIFNKANVKRTQMVSEIQQKQTALNNLRNATAGIEDLNRKIDELSKAIEFFESKLPQEKEIDTILKEVWQIAEANSLQTRTVKTLRSERGPNYSEQPIQMSLQGDFNGYYSFLLALEKLPRITRINEMNLQKVNDRDGEMTAQMTLSIFFEPDTGARGVAQISK
jgi:type IV pilus assembly protein PilO